ncbi:hypothetical protein [Alloalcanivorax xenomutans]|uniref:hypothetical protein n=1 Tax=Alloalcanivorax xenomutans TaxID=1094342 RepID=UPI0009B6A226|nr:hypothetical protein [Alloalcanivorax xenomutans]ARB46996.1 hypothetical protein P40_17575 [Alloalcanivorax xenomutans]MCE7525950.1 hypothetical protein [Alloalcanivorax xenomutans]PHS67253.1 MAG: hypothetical protein COB00_09250 [Alcanivorax sp.]
MKPHTFKLGKVKAGTVSLIEEVLSEHGAGWQRSGDGQSVNTFSWNSEPLLEHQGVSLYVHASPSNRSLLKDIFIVLDRNGAARFPDPGQWAVGFVTITLVFLVQFFSIAKFTNSLILSYLLFGAGGVFMSAGIILGMRTAKVWTLTALWRWLFGIGWLLMALLSLRGLYVMSLGVKDAWLLFVLPVLVATAGGFAYRDLLAQHYMKWILTGQGQLTDADSSEEYQLAEPSRDEVARKFLINSVIFLLAGALGLYNGAGLTAAIATLMGVGSFVMGTVMGQQKDE